MPGCRCSFSMRVAGRGRNGRIRQLFLAAMLVGIVIAGPTSFGDEPPAKAETRTAEDAIPLLVEVRRTADGKIQFPQKEFTFVRIKYSSTDRRGRGGGWATDYPDADLAFSKRVGELTSLKVDPNALVLELVDPRLKEHPFIYLCEPGRMQLSDDEVAGLRTYLNSGGFLMVDDFWGDAEWHNVMTELLRVFPKLKLVDLPLSHPIFHCVFDLQEKPQVCSIAAAMAFRDQGVTWERSDDHPVRYWGLKNEAGRLMAVFCHNTDLADGWERYEADAWYAREFSEKRAFPMGINILFHALTQK